MEDLAITDERQRVIARAGRLEAALAADSLVLVHFAPARLTADNFFVVASVSKEGRYDLGYEAHGNPDAVMGLDGILTDLTGSEKLGRPISFTRQIGLKQGRLRLIQEGGGLDWNADVATIDFSKLRGKLQSHVDMTIRSAGSVASLKAAASSGIGLEHAAISADIRNLNPSDVFPSVGVTRLISTVDAPLNGLAHVEYSAQKGFESGGLDLSAGKGFLKLGDARQDFEGARIRAIYKAATRTLIFQNFGLKAHLIDADLSGAVHIIPADVSKKQDMQIGFDFSGPRATGRLADDFSPQTLTKVHIKGAFIPRLRQLKYDSVTGLLNGAPLESQGMVYTDEQGRLGADLTAKIKGHFTKEEVFAFWPKELSDIVREDLIKRIQGGDYANADFVLKVEPGHFEHLENEDLRLDFDFENLGLEIEPRMQKASGLKGHGILLGNRFSMDVTGGRLVNVNLTHGSLLVPDFRDHSTKTQISLESQGDAVSVIEAVDPLADGELAKNGLNAGRLSGQARVRVDIAFPTFHEITDKTFGLTFNATLSDAGLKQAALGWDLSGGNLTVAGDLLADRLEIKGPAQLGPYTGDISYVTQFVPKVQTINFAGHFNAAQFGGSPRVPVPIKGHFIVGNGTGQGTVESDIFNGKVNWTGNASGGDERPSSVVIEGYTQAEGMEAQGLPIFDHLKRQLPTRISLLRSGEIWSGAIEAESLSGDLAYIQGQRPRLVYKSIITPEEAHELGYGGLPMFSEPRHLTVNMSLDGESKEALLKLDNMNAVLGWSEIEGSDELLRKLTMNVQPDDWAVLGLPRALFLPKKPLEVTAFWQQMPGSLQGRVRILGQDMAFDMPSHAHTEQAVDPAAYDLQVKGDITNDLFAGLGYVQDPVHINGTVGLNFKLYSQPDQPAAVLTLDAARAELGVRSTDWKKPAGEAAQFAVSFDDQGSGAKGGLNLSRIVGSGDHVRVDGRASFSNTGELEFADFSDIYLKDFIDVNFKYYALNDQHSNVIAITGQQLDLRPWLDSGAGKAAVKPAQTAVDQAVLHKAEWDQPTHLVIDLARLQTSNAGAFSALKLDVNWDGGNGFEGIGTGKTLDGSPLALSLKNEGNYSLFSLRSDNLGDAIHTGTGLRNIKGGAAVIEGAYSNGQVDADLRGHAVRVKQIPALAQLLTVASLQGLADTLTGDGIAFTDFDLPVRYKDNNLFIRNGWAKGEAIGINIWGTTDLDTKKLALNGTIIPAYSLNGLFGDVRRQGLGLVGLKYNLKGTYALPQTEVNPLSLALPGFIKVWAERGRKDPIPALTLPNYKDKLEKLSGDVSKKSKK